MIKDSGERTQFASGAVRDMHEGKGRFDLVPMCVLMRLAKHYENGSKKYGDRNWERASLPTVLPIVLCGTSSNIWMGITMKTIWLPPFGICAVWLGQKKSDPI